MPGINGVRFQAVHSLDVADAYRLAFVGDARGAMATSWRLRLQPAPPGWLDMGLSVPGMDTTRGTRGSGLGAAAQLNRGDPGGPLGHRRRRGLPTPPLESARH